jgi:hypothetical protein
MLKFVFKCFADAAAQTEKEEREKQTKDQELYKHRTKSHTMEILEEKDERDFKESFPDFAEQFLDLDQSSATDTGQPAKNSPKILVDHFQLYNTHKVIFDNYADTTRLQQVSELATHPDLCKSTPHYDRIEALRLSYSILRILARGTSGVM